MLRYSCCYFLLLGFPALLLAKDFTEACKKDLNLSENADVVCDKFGIACQSICNGYQNYFRQQVKVECDPINSTYWEDDKLKCVCGDKDITEKAKKNASEAVKARHKQSCQSFITGCFNECRSIQKIGPIGVDYVCSVKHKQFQQAKCLCASASTATFAVATIFISLIASYNNA